MTLHLCIFKVFQVVCGAISFGKEMFRHKLRPILRFNICKLLLWHCTENCLEFEHRRAFIRLANDLSKAV